MNARITTLILTGAVLVAGALAAFGSTNAAVANEPTVRSAAKPTPPAPPRGGPTGPQAGSFRIDCAPTKVDAIDPIVMPGHTGMSHLHQFFGNRGVNENTTAASLRAAPATSCKNPADGSAYWVPTLMNNGVAVNPINLEVFYRKTVTSPVVAHPAGLMLIAGSSKATEPQSTSIVSWSCTGANTPGTASPTVCKNRQQLVASIRYPECWNGVDLDSADHKSHLSYASNGVCAAGTIALPQIEMRVIYPRVADVSALTLASGSIYSMHADFFNGWDQRRFDGMVARLK
ncbi:MAG: hypothetical protein RLY87_2483 [Chloroflexota bacterium]|jgi:hypothetical protein